MVVVMDIFYLAFQGFWHFVGVILLVSAVFSGVSGIIKAFIPSGDIHYHIDGVDINGNNLKEFIEKREKE